MQRFECAASLGCFLKWNLSLWKHFIRKYHWISLVLSLKLYLWVSNWVFFLQGLSQSLTESKISCCVKPALVLCSLFFSHLKTYQNKPSHPTAFASNPSSASNYNTRHLPIHPWVSYCFWEGLQGDWCLLWIFTTASAAYCCSSTQPCKTAQVYLYSVSSTVSRATAVPEHKTLKCFSHLSELQHALFFFISLFHS